MHFWLGPDRISGTDLTKLRELSSTHAFLVPIIRFLEFWHSGETSWQARTSGSTSDPKPVSIRRNQMLASARTTLQFFQWDSTRHGLVLALDARPVGGFMVLVRALLADLDVLLLEPSLQPIPEGGFPEGKEWFISMVPAQLAHFLALPEAAEVSRKLTGILLGGAPLPAEVEKKLPRLACPVYQGYGMTETVSHIALRRNWPEPENDYLLLPGLEIDFSKEGTLCIRGEVTDGEWIRTRDQVEPTSKNRFRFLGREDLAINSGGLKVFPGQVLDLLKEKNAMTAADLEVLALPHPELGEEIVLVVFGDPEEETQTRESAFWTQLLAHTHDPEKRRIFPRKVFSLSARLFTTSGKTDFPGLKNQLSTHLPIWERSPESANEHG
jgi:O-succinylbenzoic acid--CoA ligase